MAWENESRNTQTLHVCKTLISIRLLREHVSVVNQAKNITASLKRSKQLLGQELERMSTIAKTLGHPSHHVLWCKQMHRVEIAHRVNFNFQ
jgi:hypothetical protein